MATLKNKTITPLPEFSGPAQFILYNRYGDPRESGFEQKWMTLWNVREIHPWFPKMTLYIHKHFRPMLDQAFKNLIVANLHHEIKTCDEGYAVRTIRGSKIVLSLHSWGAAIDLNAKENPLGSAGQWSAEFIEAMMQAGVYCGQAWEGRKDPMHFGMVNG